MCVAKLTQFMLYCYVSFKHLRLNNSTKTFWKERPAFYSSHNQRNMFLLIIFPMLNKKSKESNLVNEVNKGIQLACSTSNLIR